MAIVEGVGTPNPAARALSAVMLVAANLLPIVAVLRGHLGVGEVFVIYWCENVVIWVVTIVKILTAKRPAGRSGAGVPWLQQHFGIFQAGFFTFHFGIFTLVHGVFSFVLVSMTGGFKADGGSWLLLVGGIVVSHVVSLWVNWFSQRERDALTPTEVMRQPYPRMIALHGAVIGGFFLLVGPDGSESRGVGAVALLCGLKLVLDLGFHLRERRLARSGG